MLANCCVYTSRKTRSAINLSSMLIERVRTKDFPAKTFPERCHGSDVWYPKCDVLVPHVLPQSRTVVRPPNPYLPLSLTLKGREGRTDGRERAPLRDHRVSPATTSRDRRPSFRRTDRPCPPVASIRRWNARPVKSSKTIDEGAARHGASARR